MKFLILILLILFSSLCFGAGFTDSLVKQKDIVSDPHPDADGDLFNFCVYAEPTGTEITRNSNKICVVPQADKSAFVALTAPATITALGLSPEGATFDMCINALDNNINESPCSSPVVQYTVDTVPPSAPTGVQIQ